MFMMTPEVALGILFLAPLILYTSSSEVTIKNKKTEAVNGHTIIRRSNMGDDFPGMGFSGRCPPGFILVVNFHDTRTYRCIPVCNCKNNATCFRGICNCPQGWMGNDCSQPCSEGYSGFNCRDRCHCVNNASCDRFSGRCNCTAGYQGPLCEEKCSIGSHGYQCNDTCKCQNEATCHHVDGSCDCTAGLTGPVCAERCPEGLFGVNCSGVCNCQNNVTCNSATGECLCTKGFYGESCEIQCLSEEWGMRYPEECSCENEECTSFVGNCSCFPGFYGSNCQIRDCPGNMWGPNCSEECNCPFNKTCHPTTGACCCVSYQTKEDCSSEVVAGRFWKSVERISYTAIIAVVIISIIALLLFVVAAWFLVKRFVKKDDFRGFSRFSLLKEENNENSPSTDYGPSKV